VLNQLGIICSYDMSLRAMRKFALSQVQEMQEKVAGGEPFMLCWDNLVCTEKKEEETLYNRRELLSMTSGYVQFLHIPPPPLSATNRNSVTLGCFTNGTIAQVVTNSLSPLSGQHLYDGSGATV